MRILPYPRDPSWFAQPARYGTMTMEEMRRRLDEMAGEAARELAEERAATEEGTGP